MSSKRTPLVVVISGASSGIGRATARLFAAQGNRVVLAARTQERLEELKEEILCSGQEALVVPVDLSILEQTELLVARTVDTFGRIDVLVNNAGYGSQCRFEEMAIEDISRMFTVNVLSPMVLARAAVKAMRSQGSGCIVNVASVGGVVAHPLNVAYCATKHALVGFSKSLRLELKGTGVRVTVVCPAGTRTEFFNRAKAEIPFAPEMERFLAPPEAVARAILRASEMNKAVVFPTLAAWFLYAADKWLPWLSAQGNVRYRDRVLSLSKDPGQQ